MATKNSVQLYKNMSHAPEVATVVPPKAPNTVTVVVPKAFKLKLAHDAPELSFVAGVQEMLPEYATHWYSKAHGVTVYDPIKAT